MKVWVEMFLLATLLHWDLLLLRSQVHPVRSSVWLTCIYLLLLRSKLKFIFTILQFYKWKRSSKVLQRVAQLDVD